MSGKYTDLGMTYQKRVLMYCFICLSNSYNEFHYEGKDDIDCINTNDNRKMFIQVKSGSVSLDEKKNIFYNWIKTQPTNNCLFEIYSIKNHRYDLDAIKKAVLKDLDKAHDCDDSSNIKKAYSACLVDGTYSKEKAEEYLDIIVNHFNFHGKITEELLDKTIFGFYKQTKIHDDKFIDSQIERHIELITQEFLLTIHNSIAGAASSDTSIVIDTSTVDSWIDKAKQTYGAERYNRRQYEFVDNLDVYLDNSKREVSQLKLLDLPNDVIAEALINEVFYKDFRDYYINANENDIKSIEHKAHSYYSLEKINVNMKDKKESFELFKKVYGKTIDDPLIKSMSDATYCSSGCYVYLTSEEAKPDLQITWIETDE